MILSRTPFRVSLFGGGTDYPSWYRAGGGSVLGAAIDKYCYLTCRYLPPFFEHRFRVVYSRIETCTRPDEIRHPAVRAILAHLEIERGVEIHHDGDLPARSGMGSSSAFTVGLLHALYALLGRIPGPRQLADEAIRIEQDVLREAVGCQDQILAAHGGFNHIRFERDGRYAIRPLNLASERVRELQDRLLLFFSGIQRDASSIASSFVDTLPERPRELGRLMEIVEEAVEIVGGDGDLDAIGELLDESWKVKRGLSGKVASERIDDWYDRARRSGALGGKLTGAGGGGFFLLYARPEKHDEIRAALAGLLHVPFRFEAAGSQILFLDPEADYSHMPVPAGKGPS